MKVTTGYFAMAIMAGSALLAGCASSPPLKEQMVSKTLAPMPQADRPVGYKVVRLRDGREEVATLVAKTAETETWADTTGCRIVLPRTGFAPALEISNCEGFTGTQTVTLTSGTPYPLMLGSKWVYAFTGTSSRGDRWTGERRCDVGATVRVKANGGEHDTYRVVCDETAGNTRITRTYYVSPELQTYVFQERYRVRNWQGAPPPDRSTWEFVKQD
jgi:hypothetical protein